MPSTPPVPSDSYVQSFARGLSVIRSFGQDAPRQTLSEVAARTGLDRAGARRILLTLEGLGYVARDDRDFYLTPKILDLGYAFLSTLPLWNIAEPVIEALSEKVQESSSVSVLDGDEIVYVARVHTHKIMALNLAVGSRLTAWPTAMGRVLLGGLDEAELDRRLAAASLGAHTRNTVTDRAALKAAILADRRRGYSLVNQELEDGLCALAVPVFSRSGKVIAALNVSSTVSRTPPEKMLNVILPELQRAQERLNLTMRLKG